LIWKCNACGAESPYLPEDEEAGYELGDSEPCIECAGRGDAEIVDVPEG
jgi:hypothetical protein